MKNTIINGKSIEKLPIRELLKRIGPGLILTGIVIGPGNITTSAMLGSVYGYKLIWLIIPILFMGITFMLSSYRISMITQLPIIDCIRKYYGNFAAIIVGVATFLSCLFFTLGNITGTGAGMFLIFNINWKIGSLIMLVVLSYCYLAKNVYSKVEKAISFCILCMIICFYLTLIKTGGLDINKLSYSLTHWNFNNVNLIIALGYISTNAAVTASIYGTYLGVEKKWKIEDLFNGAMFFDALVHVLTVVLISGAVVLVGAIVLYPKNISIKSPKELADLLYPILGIYSKYVMGIALVGAGFSSLLGNTQRGVVLLNAGIQKPVGLDTKEVKIESIICIIFCTIICFLYGKSPTQLIFIANVSTAIATPVAGFFITRLIFRKDIFENYPQPKNLKYCMLISYIFVIIITMASIKKLFF